MVIQPQNDMLTRNERILVEAIRQAPIIEIVIPGYDGITGETRIKVASKTMSHDVSIALQSHFNRFSRMGGGTPIRNNIIKH